MTMNMNYRKTVPDRDLLFSLVWRGQQLARPRKAVKAGLPQVSERFPLDGRPSIAPRSTTP
jgi:hypothetical protein